MAGVLTRAPGPVHIESVLPDCEYRGDRPPTPPARQAKVTVAVIATVVFLTAIAPLATDMYVPAFPAVAADLAATATQVQLTLTTFFIGMALGQLAGGPEHPGTGSAVLGFVQWTAAGILAPIAGLGGEHTAVPMAVLMVTCIALSVFGLVLARPPAARHAPATS